MPTQKLFLDNTGLTELLNELGQYLKGKLDTLTFDTTPTVNSTNPITSGGVKAALDVKADKTELPLVVHMDDTILTCDTSIADIYTAYSVGRVVQMKIANLSTLLSLVSSDSSSAAFAVTDKGTSLIISGTNENGSDVWTIDSFVAQDRLTFDSAPTTGSQNPVTSNGIKTALDGKQNTLVSGTNIKTVNGNTLLGSGNITIDSGVLYVEYADYEEMQADMSQESGTIGCDTNLYKYYIFNGQNETWDAVTKVTDLRWIKTANGGTDTYERLLSDISNDSDLYVVNRAPASVEASNGTITVRYTDMFYIYIFEIDSTGQSNEMSAPIVTSVKNINGNQLSGSGNIVLDGSTLDYTGQGRYHLHASETIDQSLDNLDTAIHDLDNIVGEEILTPTIVEHSYIVRDPAASRGNLATSYPWRVEVFKGLSEGENLLVTYSGTDTSSSAQVAGWYTDGDNLINANYSYISNLNGYAQNIVGKTYLITVPDSTVKALALSLHTNIQAEVKRIGKIQAEIHGIENPNGIESITTTESAASGGNNTVTITETDGTTTTFNVKNGVDGVSLGEIALVQTTGDSEESVMSQKAVTEYGRKVTAEDLNGTSEWIHTRLTEEGWKIGFRLSNLNQEIADSLCCATSYIPVSGISEHSITFCYRLSSSSNNNICLYKSDKSFTTGWYYSQNSNMSRTVTVSASVADTAYIRMTCNVNDLLNCYIYNNTTGEYIFKGSDLLDELNINNNISLNYFRGTLLKQEKGSNEVVTMSQKAITDTINYNTNIQFGKCLTITDVWTYFKLTPKATTMLNASDKMTFMFSSRGTGSSQDYRYVGFGNASTADNNTFDTNGAFIYWSYSKNLSVNYVSYTLNKKDSIWPTPDVWLVTWDRINGIVKFYDRTTLLNTLTGDEYKKDRFVNDNGVLAIKGGDNKVRMYDIRIFDYDFTSLFPNATFADEIKFLEGAGSPSIFFKNNYKSSNANGTFLPYSTAHGSASGWTVTNGSTRIYTNSTTTTDLKAGYYLGPSDRARIWETDMEVISGVVSFSKIVATYGEIHLFNSNNEEVPLSNVGAGSYKLCGINCATGCWGVTRVSGDVEVHETNTRYKLISCVMHWKCDKLYNGKLYDDQTDSFITFYSDKTCLTEYDGLALSDTPQRVVRSEISTKYGYPHYAGEMAVVGNKVYIGLADYTWKQINNS